MSLVKTYLVTRSFFSVQVKCWLLENALYLTLILVFCTSYKNRKWSHNQKFYPLAVYIHYVVVRLDTFYYMMGKCKAIDSMGLAVALQAGSLDNYKVAYGFSVGMIYTKFRVNLGEDAKNYSVYLK